MFQLKKIKDFKTSDKQFDTILAKFSDSLLEPFSQIGAIACIMIESIFTPNRADPVTSVSPIFAYLLDSRMHLQKYLSNSLLITRFP